MELPITVVFEPPSPRELRALLRRRRLWIAAAVPALALGLVLVVAGVSRVEADAAAGSAPLTIISRPAGAAIVLDGHGRGHTPAVVPVAPGAHRVQLRSATAAESDYTIEVPTAGGALDALLWRPEPLLRRVRPGLPGARLESVTLLADGQVALVTRSGGRDELQAWRLRPDNGAVELLHASLPAARVALTGDGRSLAYVGREIGPHPWRALALGAGQAVDTPRSVAWHAPDAALAHAAPRAVWRAPANERLLDVSWSPRPSSLLGVTDTEHTDGTRHSRLFNLHTDGALDAEPLLTLPSGVLAGAFAWSPDGRYVVFAAHAGALNALCLLDVDGGGFRYLADLESSESPPLPYLPVAWSADSRRLLFVAPRQRPPVPTPGWLSEAPRQALYTVQVDEAEPRLVADIDAQVPAWREDGRMLLVARARDDGLLSIQVLDEAGQRTRLMALPLRVGPRYAAAWHTRSGQLLIADPTPGGTDFWLVSLAAEHAP